MTAMDLVLAGATSFAVAAAMIGLYLRSDVAVALDQPNARSLHDRPVPRVGGIAVAAGVCAGAAFIPWTLPLALLGAVTLLFAVSLLDDLYGLPISVRLFMHFAAALATAWVMLGDSRDAAMIVGAALAIAWMINAFNFMDGVDGMAGGMAIIGFLAYAWLAHAAGEPGLAGLCLVISAASAGFLAFNFSPARVFMGDAGSVPLGFLAAALGLHGWGQGAWSLLQPIVLFSPFIADASVTLARRVVSGERFWQAHRDHYYQRLIRMGWSHRRTAIMAYTVMAGAGGVAMLSIGRSTGQQILFAAIWITVLGVLLAAIEFKWRRR